MMKTRVVFGALVGFLTSFSVMAGDWVVGVDATMGEYDGSVIDLNFVDQKVDKSTGFQLFCGKMVAKDVLFKVGYSDLGEFEYKDDPDTTEHVTAFKMSMEGQRRYGDNFGIYMSLNYVRWSNDVENGDTTLDSSSGNSASIGTGLRYYVSDNMNVKLGFEQFINVYDVNINVLNAGLAVHF